MAQWQCSITNLKLAQITIKISQKRLCSSEEETYSHVILCDEGRDLQLAGTHGTIQIFNPRQAVYLLFDSRGHECGEPPSHHLHT